MMLSRSLQARLKRQFRDFDLDAPEKARRKAVYGTPWVTAIKVLCRFYDCKSVLRIGDRDKITYNAFARSPKPKVTSYDPANPDISRLPSKYFDLVILSEFIEYMEPSYAHNILMKAAAFTKKVLVVSVTIPENHDEMRHEGQWLRTEDIHKSLCELEGFRNPVVTNRNLLLQGSLRKGDFNENQYTAIVLPEMR